jgi:GA4 desaturase
VHIDSSPDGARQTLRNKRKDIVEEARDIVEAEDEALAAGQPYDGRRYAMYSVWRPLKTVKRDPIIMCDPNSIDVKRDLVESRNKSPGVKGDYLSGVSMLQLGNAEKQKWYWIREQEPDEVLFLQFYDSYAEQEGLPIGVPHGSPELIGVEEQEVRESVEARVIAFW